jgi:hypothetical protein
VCVYRDPINTAAQIVQSVYLSGRPETRSLTFEFDPAVRFLRLSVALACALRPVGALRRRVGLLDHRASVCR